MQIEKNTVVTFEYTMYSTEGKILDETIDPIAYLHGGYDNILPLLEEALHGKVPGDCIEVSMEPETSFGPYDKALVHIEPADSFPEEVEIGMIFESDDPETGEPILFRVTEMKEDGRIVVDGNHPLAGMWIRCVATVKHVRKATAEEIKDGHAHDSPHGHAH